MIRVQILSGKNWQYVLLVPYYTVSMRLQVPQLYNEDYSNYLFSFSPQLCETLPDAMDCNTPGLPVPFQLLKFAQVSVH